MAVGTYNFEVYTPDGQFVADITQLANAKRIVAGRNLAGEITFTVDMASLKAFAEQNNTTPRAILNEGVNEIRVKRDGVYLRQGGRIDWVGENHKPNEQSINKQTHVQCPGFLDMLTERYYEKKRVFTNVQVATIVWTVINEMQTASANFWHTAAAGVTAARATLGLTQGTLDTTIGTKTRTYEPGKPVKDILTQFTELVTTETDIEIDHEKAVHVRERMGSDKPQVVLAYGDNIVDYELPRDAKSIVNRAVTYGSGKGTENRVQSINQDTASQDGYRIRQSVHQRSSVQEEATLSEYGAGRVAAQKLPVTVPKILVDLTKNVSINDFWVGDRVTVQIIDPDASIEINGVYRVEAIELSISDEGEEYAMLTVSEWNE